MCGRWEWLGGLCSYLYHSYLCDRNVATTSADEVVTEAGWYYMLIVYCRDFRGESQAENLLSNSQIDRPALQD